MPLFRLPRTTTKLRITVGGGGFPMASASLHMMKLEEDETIRDGSNFTSPPTTQWFDRGTTERARPYVMEE